MIRSVPHALFVGLVLASVAHADDTAIKIVDAAIKAHGGTEALEQARTYERSAKGAMFVLNKENPLQTDLTVSLPDRFRDKIEIRVGGQKIALTRVLAGDKGWENRGGATADLAPEALKALQEECYVLQLATLVPLKAKEVTLEKLNELKIGHMEGVGVKVSQKDKPEVKMYFDKASHLLIKIERTANEAGIEVSREYFYSDHKEFDRIKVPTKVVEKTNGNKSAEYTIHSFRALRRVDDSTFGKP